MATAPPFSPEDFNAWRPTAEQQRAMQKIFLDQLAATSPEQERRVLDRKGEHLAALRRQFHSVFGYANPDSKRRSDLLIAVWTRDWPTTIRCLNAGRG